MAQITASEQRPDLMVGRTSERRHLRALLDRAIAGRGSLVLISGSAGIGKSTLADDLIGEAEERGALVLSGGCYDLTTTPPYGPWAELFRGYPASDGLPGRPTWFDNSGDLASIDSQNTLQDELRRFLTEVAGVQPLVIVLEDIHWSDPASLEALRYLARQHHIPPALLVATYRNDEIAPHHPLYQMLPLLVREAGAERIELQALDSEEIRAYVERRYTLNPEDESRLVTYLQSRTSGNPFFLSEVLRMLESEQLLVLSDGGWRVADLDQAPVPPLVRQVIETWLMKLDDDVRALLEIAAVIGEDVPLEVWQAASGFDSDHLSSAIDQATGARLLRPTSGTARVSFTHALVRETLYHRLPLVQRQDLHRRVAEILAERSDPPVSMVASHFAQAHDTRAIDWLTRAGKRALSLYAARDAAGAFSRALDLGIRFSQELPLDVYRDRASALAMTGEFARARKDLEYVLEHSRASGNHVSEWQALLDLGMLWAEQDYERTGEFCRAALELARSIGDGQMIAHSLNRFANWHVNLDQPDVALPLHQEALAVFEESGDQPGIAETLDLLGMANFLNCDRPASVTYYERAIRLLRDLDDRQRLSSSLATIVLNGGSLDADMSPSVYREDAYWLACCDEALQTARESGWAAGEAYALTTGAITASARGALEPALRDAQAACAIAERIEHRQWTVFSLQTLGQIRLELFDFQRSEADLERAVALARRLGSPFMVNLTSASLAELRVSTGALDQAAALLGTAGEVEGSERAMGVRRRQAVRAELEIARGRPDRAFEIVNGLLDLAQPEASSSPLPMLVKFQADALAGLGRFDDAERSYREARDGAALFGFRPILWRIDAALGKLYQTAGRTVEATDAYRDARAMIDTLAGEIEDEVTRERFRSGAFNLLPVDRAIDGLTGAAAGLSPREHEVLRWLVDGKSDREIAEELSISPRTVMRHVASILRKLNVSSRTAAATFAVRQGFV